MALADRPAAKEAFAGPDARVPGHYRAGGGQAELPGGRHGAGGAGRRVGAHLLRHRRKLDQALPDRRGRPGQRHRQHDRRVARAAAAGHLRLAGNARLDGGVDLHDPAGCRVHRRGLHHLLPPDRQRRPDRRRQDHHHRPARRARRREASPA
ncbi:hypothetical protein G6F59_017463 [Rhizopus arrhizus]|nr:hypothetical protein G6F59_017463 [Rhizopus arrhizus]